MSLEDKADVVESLVGLGIAESAIAFTRRGRYEPNIILVEMELGEVQEKGEQIVEAVADIVQALNTYSVHYTLSPESCSQALAQARR